VEVLPRLKAKNPAGDAGLARIQSMVWNFAELQRLNFVSGSFSQAGYLVCLRAFLTFYDIEFDVIAFFEAFVSIRLDGAVVHEDIGTLIASDEPVTFCIVEPLHFAFVECHATLPYCRRPDWACQATCVFLL
jgi:hypothetical protein